VDWPFVVVTARVGTTITSAFAFVVIAPLTVVPTVKVASSVLKDTVTGKVATPELASATLLTSVTVPVTVLPVVVVDEPAPDPFVVPLADPFPEGAPLPPADWRLKPPNPPKPPREVLDVVTDKVTWSPTLTPETSLLLIGSETVYRPVLTTEICVVELLDELLLLLLFPPGKLELLELPSVEDD
jgi:hypothetical protein